MINRIKCKNQLNLSTRKSRNNLPRFLTSFASSVKIEGMVADMEFHNVGNRFFDLVDPGIAKFINPATGCADEMIMLPALMGLFELRNVFAKLVLDHQTAVKQEFHRII
jgi:hypothetical protein